MADLKMVYEKDAPLDALKGKTVAIIGYGSQGHAHAQNMRDSGLKVIVANRKDSPNGRLAIEHGFNPMPVEDAVKQADLIIITLPDEVQPEVFNKSIKPTLKKGQALGATHGFNFHFKTIEAPKDVDVILIAPKGPGHLVRSEFEKGGGVPCLLAVFQDATGNARKTALSWGNGVGGARSGIIETTFKDECETDLFGEQAVLCGGLSALIKAGFETLTEAGYPPEMAYFECVHEVKLIVDLIYQGGLDYMRYSISNTAEYGDLTRGPRLINDNTKKEMKKILAEITSGQFAKEWRAEYEAGMKNFKRLYEADNNHPVEVTGRKLRKMMPWLKAKEPPKQS
ncbi:MAG: ketol-acid reductoisomerase [Phycisphaerales bacterium]|jgi:ketol-acid reductoisomerase|nr:ketol-acid reductoisomerase [Phycisphaerales bacterium]